MSQEQPALVQMLARQSGRILSQMVWIGAVLGVIGLAASVAFASGQPRQFYFCWLVAYLYFLSLALGSLFLVLCLFVCHAGWSVSLRRVLENTMATLPIFAVLFIPVWLGRHELYIWTDPAEVAKEAALRGKSGYLNETFWVIRAIFYFVCWSALAVYFSRESQRQDLTGDEAITRRLQRVAAPGIIVFSFTISFAAIDWMMSLEPEWYSTMYGVYYFAGSILAALAFLVLGIAFIHVRGGLRGVVTVEHTHDVGKLLFGFTIFWTYIAFSQYFLIWYGNIPEETLYYMHRAQGSWPKVAAVLIFGHFVIPFFFLMPRAIKRSMPLLTAAALWLLAMQFMDIYWCVMPVFRHESARPGVLDATTMLAVGGFFLAWLGWVSSRRALVPLRDPRLTESLSLENV
jgi:hypothetical protein